MEGYSIQVKARDQEPQTIEGTDISLSLYIQW